MRLKIFSGVKIQVGGYKTMIKAQDVLRYFEAIIVIAKEGVAAVAVFQATAQSSDTPNFKEVQLAAQQIIGVQGRLIRAVAGEGQRGRPPKVAKDEKPPAKHRGRKSMGQPERQEVSERMRKYWASRRKPSEGGRTDVSRPN
jgi:hypothetical protein